MNSTRQRRASLGRWGSHCGRNAAPPLDFRAIVAACTALALALLARSYLCAKGNTIVDAAKPRTSPVQSWEPAIPTATLAASSWYWALLVRLLSHLPSSLLPCSPATLVIALIAASGGYVLGASRQHRAQSSTSGNKSNGGSGIATAHGVAEAPAAASPSAAQLNLSLSLASRLQAALELLRDLLPGHVVEELLDESTAAQPAPTNVAQLQGLHAGPVPLPATLSTSGADPHHIEHMAALRSSASTVARLQEPWGDLSSCGDSSALFSQPRHAVQGGWVEAGGCAGAEADAGFGSHKGAMASAWSPFRLPPAASVVSGGGDVPSEALSHMQPPIRRRLSYSSRNTSYASCRAGMFERSGSMGLDAWPWPAEVGGGGGTPSVTAVCDAVSRTVSGVSSVEGYLQPPSASDGLHPGRDSGAVRTWLLGRGVAGSTSTSADGTSDDLRGFRAGAATAPVAATSPPPHLTCSNSAPVQPQPAAPSAGGVRAGHAEASVGSPQCARLRISSSGYSPRCAFPCSAGSGTGRGGSGTGYRRDSGGGGSSGRACGSGNGYLFDGTGAGGAGIRSCTSSGSGFTTGDGDGLSCVSAMTMLPLAARRYGLGVAADARVAAPSGSVAPLVARAEGPGCSASAADAGSAVGAVNDASSHEAALPAWAQQGQWDGTTAPLTVFSDRQLVTVAESEDTTSSDTALAHATSAEAIAGNPDADADEATRSAQVPAEADSRSQSVAGDAVSGEEEECPLGAGSALRRARRPCPVSDSLHAPSTYAGTGDSSHVDSMAYAANGGNAADADDSEAEDVSGDDGTSSVAWLSSLPRTRRLPWPAGPWASLQASADAAAAAADGSLAVGSPASSRRTSSDVRNSRGRGGCGSGVPTFSGMVTLSAAAVVGATPRSGGGLSSGTIRSRDSTASAECVEDNLGASPPRGGNARRLRGRGRGRSGGGGGAWSSHSPSASPPRLTYSLLDRGLLRALVAAAPPATQGAVAGVAAAAAGANLRAVSVLQHATAAADGRVGQGRSESSGFPSAPECTAGGWALSQELAMHSVEVDVHPGREGQGQDTIPIEAIAERSNGAVGREASSSGDGAVIIGNGVVGLGTGAADPTGCDERSGGVNNGQAHGLRRSMTCLAEFLSLSGFAATCSEAASGACGSDPRTQDPVPVPYGLWGVSAQRPASNVAERASQSGAAAVAASSADVPLGAAGREPVDGSGGDGNPGLRPRRSLSLASMGGRMGAGAARLIRAASSAAGGVVGGLLYGASLPPPASPPPASPPTAPPDHMFARQGDAGSSYTAAGHAAYDDTAPPTTSLPNQTSEGLAEGAFSGFTSGASGGGASTSGGATAPWWAGVPRSQPLQVQRRPALPGAAGPHPPASASPFSASAACSLQVSSHATPGSTFFPPYTSSVSTTIPEYAASLSPIPTPSPSGTAGVAMFPFTPSDPSPPLRHGVSPAHAPPPPSRVPYGPGHAAPFCRRSVSWCNFDLQAVDVAAPETHKSPAVRGAAAAAAAARSALQRPLPPDSAHPPVGRDISAGTAAPLHWSASAPSGGRASSGDAAYGALRFVPSSSAVLSRRPSGVPPEGAEAGQGLEHEAGGAGAIVLGAGATSRTRRIYLASTGLKRNANGGDCRPHSTDAVPIASASAAALPPAAAAAASNGTSNAGGAARTVGGSLGGSGRISGGSYNGSCNAAGGPGGPGAHSSGYGYSLGRDLPYAEWHPSVSVLFADVVGFTQISDRVPAVAVMEMLNALYCRLDALCARWQAGHAAGPAAVPPVYKVQIIGDAYMVATGLLADDAAHAATACLFALACLREAAQVVDPCEGRPLQLRVGVHSGPVVSGVVGRLRRQYSVFGDTVNVASRMESTGAPGAIHVSADTQRLAAPYMQPPHVPYGSVMWRRRAGVEIKGKGVMDTYWLEEAPPTAAAPPLAAPPPLPPTAPHLLPRPAPLSRAPSAP